ncbi:MAG: hypothetical protein EOP48_20470 [Sphingobacteriales bacterium]|nr:MAG: hypothetical protein EOP48_20470 [Sphingobacteriales bacterium]
MKRLAAEFVGSLSFPDANVSNFQFDPILGTLSCDVEFAKFKKGADSLVTIENVRIIVESAKRWKIEVYDHESKIHTLVKEQYFRHQLKEIAESLISKDEVVLSGFSSGKGLWTVYKFENAKFSILFEV